MLDRQSLVESFSWPMSTQYLYQPCYFADEEMDAPLGRERNLVKNSQSGRARPLEWTLISFCVILEGPEYQDADMMGHE